jgi:Glycosyl transferase family 2
VHELAHPTVTQLQRSVALCTEQPGTSWFDLGSELAAQAGAAIDINLLGAQELTRMGIAVEYAPLGYVPAWDAWHGRECDRSISLAFLGAHTKRRARGIARCVPALRGRRAAIHLVETAQPHTGAARSYLAREQKWDMLANCSVLLNVHQAPLPYMEWHRVIGAAINGCVVLSEHSLGTEPFVPGAHFISSSYEDLPHVLGGLLEDPGGMARIRAAAYDLLREQMPISATVEAVLRAVERASAHRVAASAAPAPEPMPKAPPPRQPGWEAEAEIIGEQLPIRTALKHLVTQSRKLERQIQSLQTDAAVPGETIVEHFGPPAARPRVSVLLTVYNYADYVGQAIRSVGLANLDEVEVIAVDDASSDDSVEAIRDACRQLPWLSLRLIRRFRNAGLSAARNLAAQHANADLLFVLDADNAVLPNGLDLLAAALEENPEAAFAYGLIEAFDAHGPCGILSWLDWDPARLRYGNYIDAMSMIRKSALWEAGGYSTDTALSMGWEDFALWVAMADRGMRAVRVPDFVGRYRVNPHSMLSLTDIDNSAVWAALLRKYPSLTNGPSVRPSGLPA